MTNTNSKNPITNFAKLLAQGWNARVKEYVDGSRCNTLPVSLGCGKIYKPVLSRR